MPVGGEPVAGPSVAPADAPPSTCKSAGQREFSRGAGAATTARLVHPLTLSFTDGALEAAFAARSTAEAVPIVRLFCTILPILFCLHIFAYPTVAPMSASASIATLGVQYWMKLSTGDLARFSWNWCAM